MYSASTEPDVTFGPTGWAWHGSSFVHGHTTMRRSRDPLVMRDPFNSRCRTNRAAVHSNDVLIPVNSEAKEAIIWSARYRSTRWVIPHIAFFAPSSSDRMRTRKKKNDVVRGLASNHKQGEGIVLPEQGFYAHEIATDRARA